MLMFVIPLILLGIGNSGNGFSLLTPAIYVSEGSSFFQYIVDNDNKLSKCSTEFLYDRKTIIGCELDLHTASSSTCEPSFQDTNNLTRRITSLGNSRCGFRLDNASSTDPPSWTLKGSNNSTNYDAKFKVLFYAAIPAHITQQVTIGGPAIITCGSSTQNQDYCHLYNPEGELVSSERRCEFYIQIVTLQDLGRWHCTVGALQYFEAMVFTIDLINKGVVTTDAWVENYDDFVAIGCRINNMTSKLFIPTYCMMTSPHGEELVIRPGSAIGRITTLFTNLQARICAIEIRKPLLVHDMGIWRCEIGDRGHVLQVGNNADYVQNITSVAVELGQLFTVRCMVSYTSTNCFIVSPNGTRYLPDKPSRSEIGECEVTLTAEQEHHGMWLCHFFKKNDPESHKVKFDVTISNGMTCSKQVSATRGYEVQLFCKTGRAPLQYCWFISPSNEIYQLEAGINSTRLAYIGRGLEHGDCGIKIHSVWKSDQGNWTCITRLGYGVQGLESNNTLTLTVIIFGTTLSTVVGSIFGVVVIVSIVWGAIACTNKRRRIRISTSQTELNGSTSVDSSEAQVRFAQGEHSKYS